MAFVGHKTPCPACGKMVFEAYAKVGGALFRHYEEHPCLPPPPILLLARSYRLPWRGYA